MILIVNDRKGLEGQLLSAQGAPTPRPPHPSPPAHSSPRPCHAKPRIYQASDPNPAYPSVI